MKVTILGAGIGGLCTAIALRLKGFDVEVFERNDSISDIGAGIVCWPNASFVLDELGVLDKIADIAGLPTKMRRLSSRGESLGSLDIQKLNAHMHYPSYSILRRDLMSVLYERLTELGARIEFNHTVTNLKNVSSSVTRISFSNGLSVDAEMTIGADGRMNSIARQFVRGDNKPEYQGFINWIGVFESEFSVFDEIVVQDYWGVGERFGIVPITVNKAYWAGGVAAKEIGYCNPDQYKSELKPIFAQWPDPITTLIEKTPQHSINKIYVHDHNPGEVWHRENVLIIGDAAHAPLPTSGQGACQAMEDAWHLSRIMEEDCSDISVVFERFTQVRSSKTSGITMGARKLASSLFNNDPMICEQRNQQSKNTDYNAVVQGMAKGWASGLPISA